MKYTKFIINGYRGISDVTEISISKESLIPIIGKNESGKTTFLEAILSFDHNNDKLHSGKHLKNVANLYSTAILPIVVSAEIDLRKTAVLKDIFADNIKNFREVYFEEETKTKLDIAKIDFEDEDNQLTDWKYLKAIKILLEEATDNLIRIDRDLISKSYSIGLLSKKLDDDFISTFSETLINELPYILYFDDFRDRLPEKIFINAEEENSWIEYIDELFKSTSADYSVHSLPERSDSIRRSIIKEVQQEFNQKLLDEWSKYQFDKNENIVVQIDYEPNVDKPFLVFKIVETISIDGKQKERFFDISDRSKGFYWYINFMIKLHYNPDKRDLNDKDTIYLLDEPGSYLHTFALNKLAEQLKFLSIDNKVIYCTHSHNLLNPEFIPINSIRLAEKNREGKILLKRLDHKGIIRPNKNSAYQTIFDALEVRPPLIEFDYNDIVLLEGIYDFYCFKMFTSENLSYFPCVSASSIINQIPFMIFLGKRYLALWDNDNEGRARLKKACEYFGEIEALKFLTLDNIGEHKNTRLEDYFNMDEVTKYSGLNDLNNKSIFSKFVLELFYARDREKIIAKQFKKTSLNFKKMEKKLLGRLI